MGILAIDVALELLIDVADAFAVDAIVNLCPHSTYDDDDANEDAFDGLLAFVF